ncbi:zinc finger, CCHC-type containing protein [Tanacetum coccineum]
MKQPIPTAPVATKHKHPDHYSPSCAQATYNELVKNQKEIAVIMLLTMDLEIQQNLAHLWTPIALLKRLKLYILSKQNRNFYRLYIDQLERHGHPVTLKPLSKLILWTSLRIEQLWCRTKILQHWEDKNKKKKPSKAAKGVHGKGKGKMVYANAAPSYAPKPKNTPPPKKDNPAKDTICHHCGEVGHWRRNYPTYLTELLKKKQLPQGASTLGIFTIELYSFPSTSWVYDTGCGTHICNTTQGLWESKKLNPGSLSLYLGNG